MRQQRADATAFEKAISRVEIGGASMHAPDVGVTTFRSQSRLQPDVGPRRLGSLESASISCVALSSDG